MGKTRSCSSVQSHAQQNFNLIVCWWVGMCALPVCCLRAYAMGHLPELLLPVPLSSQEATANPHLPKRPPSTSREVWFNPLWGHCSFPLCPGAWMILFLPSKSEVSVSPSPRSPAIKSLWLSKPDSLGILSPFVRFPSLEKLMCGSEPSQQWENFFGIIFLQFVACLSGGYGIWFYHYFSPPTISLWLLLCLLR